MLYHELTVISLSSFVKCLSLLSIFYLAVFFIIELQEYFIPRFKSFVIYMCCELFFPVYELPINFLDGAF